MIPENLPKPIVFISHISEEAELATLIESQIKHDWLGHIDVVVCSDDASIAGGQPWLDQIERALGNARMMLVLCSMASIKRRVLGFAAGAVWMKPGLPQRVPIIPVCHSGMQLSALPIPLNLLPGIVATNASGWVYVYMHLAAQLGTDSPQPNLSAFVAQISKFERNNGMTGEIAVSSRGPGLQLGDPRKRVYYKDEL